MNSPEANKSRHLSVVLPDCLIEEVLSLLNVKSLMKFKCVCKSWNTLITCDPTFIKLHLKLSTRNQHLALIYDNFNIVFFPLTSLCLLIQNTITFDDHPYFHEPCFRDPFFHRPYEDSSCLRVVGSCNGLLCLYGYDTKYLDYHEMFLYLWNPATKLLSNKIVFLHLHECNIRSSSLDGRWKFWFGYHNSTDNYKIVAFCLEMNEVRVFNLGDNNNNIWRHIHSFPVVPLDNFSSEPFCHQGIQNPGVYVSGTVNWLAIPNVSRICSFELRSVPISINQFVIISLDLSTETYRQYRPPLGDQVVSVEPTLTVLMDSLCFSHDFHGTHFIIWQMKEFGFEESWTQFLKISYKNLADYRPTLFPLTLFPLCISENDDTLVVVCEQDHYAILYNMRYERGHRIRISNLIQWFCANNYVESLVSIPPVESTKERISLPCKRLASPVLELGGPSNKSRYM